MQHRPRRTCLAQANLGLVLGLGDVSIVGLVTTAAFTVALLMERSPDGFANSLAQESRGR